MTTTPATVTVPTPPRTLSDRLTIAGLLTLAFCELLAHLVEVSRTPAWPHSPSCP
ncbi:hypothetical protein [Streptomyces sp. MH13]|uniref:hypothetical protein n=1 Tax=Streptomyces sp. MH13 TaxID=3417651 RepID=UPI003CEF6F41